GPAVPLMLRGRWRCRRQRQESTSLSKHSVHFRGLPNLCGPSAPPPPAQTSQRPRRHLLGTYKAKTDAVQALPAGPRRFCRTELVESPGAAPGASELAEGSLPHPTRLLPAVGPRSEKASGPPHRTDPSSRFSARTRQCPPRTSGGG